MTKPAWLDNLRPLDRQLAERWLRQAGESRLITIAAAAILQKRPKHRPVADYHQPLIKHALLFWLTHSEMDISKAATAATIEFQKDALPGDRVKALTFPAARRIAFAALQDPPSGLLADAEREAESRGLPVRTATEHARQLEETRASFQRLFKAMGVSLPVSLPPTPAEPPAQPVDPIGLRSYPVENTSPFSAHEIERLKRIGHLLRALHGLISPDTPISRLSTLFDDMIEALATPTK